MLAGNMSFPEALAFLKTNYSLDSPPSKGRTSSTRSEWSSQSKGDHKSFAYSQIQSTEEENFITLYEAFLTNLCVPLMQTPGGMYLEERGIRATVADAYGVRYCPDFSPIWELASREQIKISGLSSFYAFQKHKLPFLVFPYLKQGKPLFLKARCLLSKSDAQALQISRFLNSRGTVPCLWNHDSIDKATQVLICEGEIDALSAITFGYVSVGLPGWAHWKDIWVRDFFQKEVFLVLDADPAGRAGALAIARQFERVALPRPRQVFLEEGRDLNDTLRAERTQANTPMSPRETKESLGPETLSPPPEEQTQNRASLYPTGETEPQGSKPLNTSLPGDGDDQKFFHCSELVEDSDISQCNPSISQFEEILSEVQVQNGASPSPATEAEPRYEIPVGLMPRVQDDSRWKPLFVNPLGKTPSVKVPRIAVNEREGALLQAISEIWVPAWERNKNRHVAPTIRNLEFAIADAQNDYLANRGTMGDFKRRVGDWIKAVAPSLSEQEFHPESPPVMVSQKQGGLSSQVIVPPPLKFVPPKSLLDTVLSKFPGSQVIGTFPAGTELVFNGPQVKPLCAYPNWNQSYVDWFMGQSVPDKPFWLTPKERVWNPQAWFAQTRHYCRQGPEGIRGKSGALLRDLQAFRLASFRPKLPPLMEGMEREARVPDLLPSTENDQCRSPFPNWSQELVDKFLSLEPPEEPFEVGPGDEVWVPAWYFRSLRLDCELGPTGPRARNGALKRDLENLLKALKIENGKCKPLKLLLSDSHSGQSSKKRENKIKRKSHPKERTEDFWDAVRVWEELIKSQRGVRE